MLWCAVHRGTPEATSDLATSSSSSLSRLSRLKENGPASTEPHEAGPTGDTAIVGPDIPVDVKDEKGPPDAGISNEPTGDSTHSASEDKKPEHVQDGAGTEYCRSSNQEGKEEDGTTAEKHEAPSGTAENTVDDQNDDSKYPRGAKLWILTFGLCLAIFVVALDNTIIAAAIPRITTVFDSLNDVGWYGSSYLLTTTSLQPSFGKIYTYFDVKWTYLSALIIFELGSVLCAAAKNSVMLIVGRAVAGVGASALFSGSMTIIAYSVALRKRAIYGALLASMFGISSVIGPLLGGVLTDRASWRWCFWINLPVGGVALLTVAVFFKNPERKHAEMSFKEKLRQMDLLGAFLLTCGVVCLLLALQWGGSTYPWHDSKVWGCMLGCGLIIVCFIGLQFKLADR